MRQNVLTRLSIVLFPALIAATAQPQDKPNIVLVLMDNLGCGERLAFMVAASCAAHPPHWSAGCRRHAAPELQCRGAMHSEPGCAHDGTVCLSHGNGSVPIDTPRYGLVQWEYTIAEMLSDVGYATGAFGKWHLDLPADRIRRLGITMVQAMAIVKRIGVGSAKALRGADLTPPAGA